MTRAKEDKFQLIADKILEQLHQGVTPWRKPWKSEGYANLVTSHRYTGKNPLYCHIDVMANNFTSPFFLSFKQGESLGWKLKKGSKATWINFSGVCNKKIDGAGEDEPQTVSFRAFRWIGVFNSDLWSDDEAETKKETLIASRVGEKLDVPRVMEAEEFVTSQNADIVFQDCDRCSYSPSKDRITMMPYESFTSSETYYATLVHELTHWTGSTKRLSRDLSGKFGSVPYAREELVADLGAAFVCNELGLSPEIENHASYIASWMAIIKDDSKAFFNAMDAASKAAKFLLANAGIESESNVESNDN